MTTKLWKAILYSIFCCFFLASPLHAEESATILATATVTAPIGFEYIESPEVGTNHETNLILRHPADAGIICRIEAGSVIMDEFDLHPQENRSDISTRTLSYLNDTGTVFDTCVITIIYTEN